jgi:hypothetical protein
MDIAKRFRQRRLTAITRRLRYFKSRLFGSRLQKSQSVFLVDANGARFKRIILRDSYLASQIEEAMEQFGPSPSVPGFVTRYEHEVWVDFVAGEEPGITDQSLIGELAKFYATIYARAPREIASAGSIWIQRVGRDLEFLSRVGILTTAMVSDLNQAVTRLVPDKLLVGFDYNDPVLKNFIRTASGRLCGIDVESLVTEELVGLGVAKALARWMEPYRNGFFDAYGSTGAPDFRAHFEFVELVHLAAYTRLMFIEQKWANVDAKCFERFV